MPVTLPRLPLPREEDLFQDSTMSFGEHLDELRYCLWMAILGLGVGVLIGLAVGRPVVRMIQSPLERNLRRHLQEQSLEDLAESGQMPAGASDAYQKFVFDNGLIYEDVLVDPAQLEPPPAGEPTTPPATAPPAAAATAAPTSTAPATAAPAPGADTTAPSATRAADLPRQVPRPEALRKIRIWRQLDHDPRVRAKTLSVHEGFMIYIKAALLAGVILSSPWVFYWLWSFVAAGLYPHEKHYVYTFLPFSLGLFLAGAALAFFFVFDPVLNFLFSYNRWLGIDSEVRISEWMSFVLMLPLGFGISFQLPLVMLFLERISVFNVQVYVEKWRMAVLVIAFVSMVLTPSDPYSMLLMLVPLTILYFGGILLCRYLPARQRAPEA